MYNSNKGNLNILMLFVVLMIFGLFSMIYVTIGYLQFAIGNDYIVIPLYNISQSTNYSAEIMLAFDEVGTNYQNFDLSLIDDMWFFGYLVVFIMSFGLAYQSRDNYFVWLSILLYGLMFILFIVGLYSVILQFWYNEILLNLFTNLVVSTPKFAYFVNNYGAIFLFHAAALLLIKQVDLDFSSLRRRKDKENASLEGELL